MLGEVIHYYSQFRAIVTDRYHGTIFALVAGTPVIVLRTTDHKVTSGATWLNRYYPEYVYPAQSLDEAVSIAGRLRDEGASAAPQAWPHDHYRSRLKGLVDSL